MAVERLQPGLGTFVRIRASTAGLDERRAQAAVSAAFAEVRRLHALMSFHEPDSALSRLNRGAAAGLMAVGPDLAAVIALALEVAEASGGAFDPSVGGAAVRAGRLPPLDAAFPDPKARWTDIRLDRASGEVVFARRLWLDLGGIAKGYAVDRAIAVLVDHGVSQALVDAGGDLRTVGPVREAVALERFQALDGDWVAPPPVVELADAALASSDCNAGSRCAPDVHLDGAAPGRRVSGFASVVAPTAAVADALTKVVLARPRSAARVLRGFGAWAVHRPASGRWTCIGAPA